MDACGGVGDAIWRVGDRVTGYRNQLRVQRNIDPDAHAGQADADADLCARRHLNRGVASLRSANGMVISLLLTKGRGLSPRIYQSHYPRLMRLMSSVMFVTAFR